MRNKDKLLYGKVLINASFVCVVIAFLGALGFDLWLASTQWLLVGLTLSIWAVYLLIEAQFRL